MWVMAIAMTLLKGWCKIYELLSGCYGKVWKMKSNLCTYMEGGFGSYEDFSWDLESYDLW